MQKYSNRCVVLLLILSALPAFAAAQAAPPKHHSEWEASFFGGFASASDQSSLTPVEGESAARSVGLDYKNGYLVGARVTQNLGEKLGAELEYSFADQPFDFKNLRPTLPNLATSIHTFHHTDGDTKGHRQPSRSRQSSPHAWMHCANGRSEKRLYHHEKVESPSLERPANNDRLQQRIRRTNKVTLSRSFSLSFI